MAKPRKRKDDQNVNELVGAILVLQGAFLFAKIKLHVHIPWPFVFGPLYFGTLLYFLVSMNRKLSETRYRNSSLSQIDQMKGEEFEELLQVQLKRQGWKLQLTARTGDGGADLIGSDPSGRKTVIQAKRWKATVGVKAVQEVHTARSLFHAERALIITNRSLSKQAWEMAKELHIEVWGRNAVNDLISKAKKGATL